MAGAKETPRQRMIGMMYLVLTALLALNVSVEVLDAFSVVNEGIESTSTSVERKIVDYYDTFEQQYNKQPEKAEEYWYKAQEIRTKTDELINFIEREIKLQLLIQNQGVTEEELMNPKKEENTIILNPEEVDLTKNRRIFHRINLKNLLQKDKYDVPTNFMITQGNAEKLRKKIEEYRQYVVNTVESVGVTNYDNSIELRTNEDYYAPDGSKLTWEEKNFNLVIMPATISILNEIITEIQTAEYDAIAELFKKIGASDFKFNTLTAKVFPKSTYVLSGQNYEADVFIVASDDTREFDAKYIRGAKQFSPNSKSIQSVSSKNGIVTINIPTKEVGEQSYAGVIEMINPETGEVEPYPFQSSFTVAPPSATAAPTKMNIVYRGLENPIQISAPGFTNDEIQVSINKGTISEVNKTGLYMVKILDTISETATITTSTMIDGKKVVLGSTDFKIKSVPHPTAKIAGRLDGKIYKEELLKTDSITPELPDFEFDGYNFTIESYTFIKNIGGNDYPTSVKGGRFDSEVMKSINAARPGQRFTFENIQAKGPDGKIVRLNSISIKVQ